MSNTKRHKMAQYHENQHQAEIHWGQRVEDKPTGTGRRKNDRVTTGTGMRSLSDKIA
jgi:hypothetical protein